MITGAQPLVTADEDFEEGLDVLVWESYDWWS